MRALISVLMIVTAFAAARTADADPVPENVRAPALRLTPGMGWRLSAIVRVDLEGEIRVLIIEGDVINASEAERPSPKVRLGVRDGDGREMFHLLVRLDEPRIKPRDYLPFAARLESPPPDAATIEIQTVETE